MLHVPCVFRCSPRGVFVVVFARDVHQRFCDTRTPNNLHLQRITIPLILFLSMLFYVTFIEVSLSKAATEAHDTELSGFFVFCCCCLGGCCCCFLLLFLLLFFFFSFFSFLSLTDHVLFGYSKQDCG